MISQKIKYWTLTITVLVVAAVLFLFPTKYYIKKPGEAYGAADYIQVENRDVDDEGQFRFTTVSVMPATPFLFGLALMIPHQDIVERSDIFQDEEDPDEYQVRQLEMMDNSKYNAIKVAFQQAGLPVTTRFKGLTVLNVLEDSAADGELETGDVIVEAAGKVLQNAEAFTQALEHKQQGETIELVIKRGKELNTKTITLKEIPKAKGKIGVGITYTEQKTIQSDPHVKMNTEDIGGPSAGLMFTLEILNQLLDEDIAKGYSIAGTGTMNEDGTVGRIGGIDKKVIAAAKAGADYFLAPEDVIPDEAYERNPMLKTNYEEALQAVGNVETDMEIVPVQTIDDAMKFLNSLQPKGE